ncbi:MAG TPA: hypothetical protein VEH55_04880 [Gaiellaceae bacterium]|nr:hypothetical protein [Gaiellaceae bacterium]
MHALWKHRPSPATVIASLALAVALGGTGYAALVLPANSVGTAQLKNGAVTSLKVKSGSLLATNFKAGQLPRGPAGPTGATGPIGPTGPPGPYPDTLASGKTVRGSFSMGGTADVTGALADTGISFVYSFAAPPSVKIVLQGAAAPAECPGNATAPQAQPGYLCIYETAHSNSSGATLNSVTTAGATIFTNASGGGGFFSYGTWAATAP